MASAFPAQFVQFPLKTAAKDKDVWTARVRGPGNFMCRSSVLASKSTVSLTYEPRFTGNHTIFIERNGE